MTALAIYCRKEQELKPFNMRMGFDPIYLIITVVAMGLSKLASSMLQKRFKEYSALALPVSGKEVAEQMLRDNDIHDVKVISVKGQLTDHYNPANKTVNLSEVVYNQKNVSAVAVAAHEVGHAIQHAKAYGPLTFRSKMVPTVQFSSKMTQILIMAGFAVMMFMQSPIVLGIGIAFFAVTTLFTFVTLPVEFDASKRALAWLETANITSGSNHVAAKSALKWAASTYVVAALASLGQLLYYIMIFMRMSNRNNR